MNLWYVEFCGQSALQVPFSTVGGRRGGNTLLLALIVVEAFAFGIKVDMMSWSSGTMQVSVQSTGGQLIPHVESKANATLMELNPSILQRKLESGLVDIV